MPIGQLYPARLCRLCRCQPAPPPAPKGQADTNNRYPMPSAHTAGGEFSESFSLLPPPVPPWGKHCSRGDSINKAGHTLGVASLRTVAGFSYRHRVAMCLCFFLCPCGAASARQTRSATPKAGPFLWLGGRGKKCAYGVSVGSPFLLHSLLTP